MAHNLDIGMKSHPETWKLRFMSPRVNITIALYIIQFADGAFPYAYRDPHMHTRIPICIRGFPICIQVLGESHLPVCIWRSLYAYGDHQMTPVCIQEFYHLHMHICIWGIQHQISPFAYERLTNPLMQMEINKIPVCIRLYIITNPHMHMGIEVMPVCIRVSMNFKSPYDVGITSIPICKHSHQYAYGDIPVTNHFYTVVVCIWGFRSPDPHMQIFAYGDPHLHIGVLGCIWHFHC
jgi:hypothetical protein